MTTKCPKCNTDNPDTKHFCGDCGTQLGHPKDIHQVTKTFETHSPQFSPGTSLAGRYEIIKELGRGGMGEVYLAEDTNLKRQVAIKVLPQPFALDQERLARFEREARVLASLNHPNIATIYGLERSDGRQLLVMELVEGETLAELLKKGPLPVEEALDVCRQIAEGLESAHDNGIIHRDLKPANIKITPDRKIKILDFGLAKAYQEEPGAIDLSKSPTLTDQMTQPGAILGTAAYMSPEQARSRPVDRRADIWAFGCVLYECLTGEMAIQGETFSDTLAHILKGDLDWSKLPSTTPSTIKILLRRCLQKDSHKRLHDIADVRIELDEAITLPAEEVPVARRLSFGWIITVGASMLLVGVLIGFILWKSSRSTPTPSPVASVIKVEPEHSLHGDRQKELFDLPTQTTMTISKDGSFMVYDAIKDDDPKALPQLFLRRIDKLNVEPIPGTELGVSPFLSPDERWIGFLAHDLKLGKARLKKVPIEGGVPQDLCAVPGFGACWTDNDMIILSFRPSSGLFSISAAGGTPEVLTEPNREIGEYSHRLPFPLPHGKGVLFTIMRSQYDIEPQVAILENASRNWRVLLEDAAHAKYVPTGHIVFLRKGNLMAVAFDLDTLKVIGQPVRIVPDVMHMLNANNHYYNTGTGQYSISDSGSLVYATGGIIPDPQNQLVWVDKNGVEEPIGSFKGPIITPRLSPDGRKIVYSTAGTKRDIWIYDIERDSPSRLVADGNSRRPLWTPDGKRILFTWESLIPPPYIYLQPADGSAEREQLITYHSKLWPGSVSPDGELLAFTGIKDRDWDILIYSFRDKNITPFLETDYFEGFPEFSPDGRWLAYVSEKSGEYEVYVRSSAGTGGVWKISHQGGTAPIWARNGKQIFYRNDDKAQVWVVDIQTESDFYAGPPRLLFEKPGYHSSNPIREYDLSLDGKRFLMVKNEVRESRPVTEMILIQNWFEELKRRVPTEK